MWKGNGSKIRGEMGREIWQGCVKTLSCANVTIEEKPRQRRDRPQKLKLKPWEKLSSILSSSGNQSSVRDCHLFKATSWDFENNFRKGLSQLFPHFLGTNRKSRRIPWITAVLLNDQTQGIRSKFITFVVNYLFFRVPKWPENFSKSSFVFRPKISNM